MLNLFYRLCKGGSWGDLAEVVVNYRPHAQGTLFGEYPDVPETRLAYQV